MYPLVRLAKVMGRNALRHRPLAVAEASELHFRVWPGDLDFNLHFNDGRYLTLTNLGRVDFMQRSGVLKLAVKNRWAPVIAAAHIQYKRELRAFQRFRLTTRIVGWDEKWFYIVHEIHRGEKTACTVWLRGGLRQRGGMVPPGRLLDLVPGDHARPQVPSEILSWAQALDAVPEAARPDQSPGRAHQS